MHVALLAVMMILMAACGGQDGTAGDDEPADSADDAGSDDGAAQDGDDGDDDGDDGDDPEAEPEPEPEDGEDDDEVADFYSGNTVTIIVSTAPGGGFDAYARLIAEHFGSYIPGEPDIIVENMPGAGHMLAMNYVYSAAPRDGSVIGNATGGLAIEQLFESERAEFDMAELFYLGSPDPMGNMVFIARADAGVTSFDQLLEDGGPELVVAVDNPGSLQTDPASGIEQILGANVRVVPGYDSSADKRLALDQGEADAWFTSWNTEWALNAERFESGEWVVLTQFAAEPDEGLEDVPVVYEFASNEEEEMLLALAGGPPRSHIRPYFLPPEVPEDRAWALHDAFQAVLTDSDFLAAAEQANLDIQAHTGEEVQDAFLQLLTVPDDVKEQLRGILQP